MRSIFKKIVYTIIGTLLMSYFLLSLVNFSDEQVSLLKNQMVTDFVIEHILVICHIMGITLFVIGLAALFKTVIYMRRETYERQNMRHQ